MLPKWIGPGGIDTAVQPLLGQNKVGSWQPPGDATTVPGVFGFTAPTAVGTPTARTVATTNLFNRMRRLGYNGAATAGQAAGQYTSVNQFTVGDGTGLGGFFYICRFGAADAVTQTIAFTGLSSLTATPVVTTSPATFVNCIGVGAATGDTNLSIYYAGSAAQTPIALGTGFPKSGTANTTMYEAVFYSPNNVNGTNVGYKITNLTTANVVTGTLTAATPGTQLPANTTLLSHRAYRSNNATAQACLIDIVSIYIETDD